MKWVYLLGNFFTVGWVGYFTCTHLFRNGTAAVSHTEMTWVCFAALGAAIQSADKCLKENWK